MTIGHQDAAAARKPTVLVVDSHSTTRQMLCAWLQASGYTVSDVGSAEEAWESVQSSCPTIILTAWELETSCGLDLCRRVRAEHSRHEVYLLITTSRDEPEDVMQAMAAGADDFLTEPIDRHDLLARFRQAECTLDRLRDQARLADTDPLTRLLNRRMFFQHCEREIARAQRDQSSLACILLDADYFKQVNDTYGHTAGDEALRAIADSIRTVVRPDDYAGRLGGDEFCILLPSTSEQDAATLGERLQSNLKSSPLTINDGQLELSVTLGVADWKENITTPDELVDLADQALLAAKQSGRGRLMRFGELVSEVSESAHQQYRRVLAQIVASDVMTSPVISLNHDQPIRDAAGLFFGLRIGSAPVLDDECTLVGIVEETDLLNAAVSHSQWATPVGDVMKRKVVSYDENTPVVEIWDSLRRVTIHHVVIVSNGVPVGVLSRSTLLRWLSNWSAVLAREGSSASLNADDLKMRLRTTTQAISTCAGSLDSEIDQDDAELAHIILSAATRLQENAQDLLVLCQPHQRFEPGV